ncbi:MAG TPA: ankyrin repeat domain-containing protein [Burkholderiaceae bacterium]|nr:ankyrin repeat domain-containing protein [Burkholderiaceae bacterium]
MKSLFAALIILVALIALAIGVPLILQPDTGGFLSGIGVVLGLVFLAAGNLLVLALNLAFRHFYGAPRWLRVLIRIQLVPAAVSLVMLAVQLYDSWQEGRAADQHVALYLAIKSNDVGRFDQAQRQCGKQCSSDYSLNAQLLDAADTRAGNVAEALIRQHAKVSTELGQATVSLRTCEGDYLADLNALGVAVARHDASMVDELFPVSDKGARRKALWVAARLNHLDLVKDLAAKGVPLTIRGPILNENDTLLVAAASGAALEVGKWLLDTQYMPVNAILGGPDPYPGTSPLQALMRFQSSAPDSPRIKPFLQMLVAHGAKLDVRDREGRTPLQEAIRMKDKRLAQMLLSVGAGKSSLTAEEGKALEALLAQPGPLVSPPHSGGDCVAP